MHTASTTVLEAKERAWQYWFVDGLTHLLLGIAFLAMSFSMLYPPAPRSYWALALWASLMAIYVGIMLWQRPILEWLKSKITYPRTGYVESPFDAVDIAGPLGMVELGLGAADERREQAQQLVAAQRRRLPLVATLAVFASIALLALQSRWVYTIAAVLFAAATWAVRQNEKVSWFSVAGLPIVGLGMTIFLPPDIYRPHRIAWLLAGWGVLLALDGAVALARYLMGNPAPKATQT